MKQKLIIVTPELHRLGGIANHHLGLMPHWRVDVVNFVMGRRNDHTTRLLSGPLIPYDLIRFAVCLIRNRGSVVMLNPSFRPFLIRLNAFYLIVAHIFGHRTVVFIHGFDTEYAQRIRRRGWLYRWVYNKASLIYVLYSGFRDILMQTGITVPIKLTTTKVANEMVDGIDIPVRHHIDTLLFVARLVPEKGIMLTLQIFKQLKENHPALRLCICGDGPSRKEAERYVATHGLTDVEFKGKVSGTQLRDCYLQSDLYILPTYSEGMATTILEAMAMGLNIVSRPVGGVVDFWSEDDMGFLIESTDCADYTRCIEQLMADPDGIAHRSAFNRQYAQEHFLASDITRRIEEDLAPLWDIDEH